MKICLFKINSRIRLISPWRIFQNYWCCIFRWFIIRPLDIPWDFLIRYSCSLLNQSIILVSRLISRTLTWISFVPAYGDFRALVWTWFMAIVWIVLTLKWRCNNWEHCCRNVHKILIKIGRRTRNFANSLKSFIFYNKSNSKTPLIRENIDEFQNDLWYPMKGSGSFLLPINERDNEGSHPFHYENTEKSVLGKENNN